MIRLMGFLAAGRAKDTVIRNICLALGAFHEIVLLWICHA
jgi:hypothetical protein